MARRWLSITLGVAFPLLSIACGDSPPPRSPDGESEPSEGRHDRFKRELRESTQSLGRGMERVQGKTREAVRHVGEELGVRREVLGTADAGAEP